MNLSDLRAAFRRDGDDRAEPYLWSDADVDAWLNEAQRQACIRARLLFFRDTLPVTAGDPLVTLPRPLFEIRFAALNEGTTFRRMLRQFDALERDRVRPHWREQRRQPDGFVHRDGEIELNAQPDRDYLFYFEGYRLPCPMRRDQDEPEMDEVHHIQLVHWALFKAHSVPDKEMFSPDKAAEHEARFEMYFGRKPTADLRKAQNANNPHHNKCWW